MARALRGIGIGHDARRAGGEQAVDKGADEGGAVAAVDHVRLADELVDAARSARVLAQAVVRPRGRVVALQIGERPVAERDDKLVHGRVIEVSADQSQLLLRIAPPLRDVRHRQPAPNHRQVRGRIGRNAQTPGTMDHASFNPGRAVQTPSPVRHRPGR